MKNEGFTLIELLAVLLILAFIAIIAVPQILNLIEESKIKSLKISTSEYIRAVNTSLINEEVFNNVKDGLYTITDDGKKIVLGDKEIYIASEGHGLRSGLLLIEDSKVKRVLKGMIDDYYARVNGEEITILKNLNESTLVAGSTFNAKIKKLVGDEGTDGADPNSGTVDTTVKKITFLQDSVLPVGYTKDALQTQPSTDLSKNNDESIKGYYEEKTGTIYVYSDGYISCPADINNIFSNFGGVEEIELNLIDTSKTINMGWIFLGCSSLKNINLLGLDTSSVTNMKGMFRDCRSLEELDLSKLDTSSVTAICEYNAGFLEGCTNLKKLDLSNFKATNITDIRAMFSYCRSLEELDLSDFNPKKLSSYAMQRTYRGAVFENCTNLKKIKFSKNFNTTDITDISNLFRNCSSLEELDLSMFDTSQVIDMNCMFYNCTNLKTIIFGNKFNASKVTNMREMFNGCNSLKTLDFRYFDTSRLTWMDRMFNNCNNLKEIKGIENLNTEIVSNMTYMFNGCSSLEELDLSNWDTSQVKDIIGMFENCSSLKTLNLSNWNTSQVTSMFAMFDGCNNLINLNISNFDTTNVTNMRYMFNGCSSLEELDLTSFDTKLVIDIYYMFQGCTNLKTTKVSDKWTLGKNHSSIQFV